MQHHIERNRNTISADVHINKIVKKDGYISETSSIYLVFSIDIYIELFFSLIDF